MNTRTLLTATTLTLGLSLLACAPAPQPQALPDPSTYQIAPTDLSTNIPEIGQIGLWMVTKNLVNATWLGEKVDGRTLHEPINIILLDRVAQTPEQATSRLLSAMQRAGYGPKNMHSDGYYGFINGQLYAQHPTSGKGLAFSDGPWYTRNNHGRLFGPARVEGGFVFTGAVSRENFRLLPKPGHPYNSFQATREDLANQLHAKTTFKRAGYVELGSVIDNPTDTTGDHDGRAVLMMATE